MSKIVSVSFLICFVALMQVQSSFQVKNDGLIKIKETRSENEGREYLANTTQEASTRIFFGAPAADGQFPYFALLLFYGVGGTFTCGGTIISQTWTLTSAQCFPIKGVLAVTLFAGSIDRLAMPVVRSGISYVQHPQFTFIPLANDVALIQLNIPINPTSNPGVAILGLPSLLQSVFYPYMFSSLVTMGFGDVDDQSHLVPRFLTYIQLTTTDQLTCWYADSQYFDFSKFCAKNSFAGSICPGDNGSPAVLTSLIGGGSFVGVASFASPPICTPDTTNVFSKVSSYNSWISTYTGISINWI